MVSAIDLLYAQVIIMKHLDNLTIHKFRGLRDLDLQDLGQINILVGGNNSGKTSVLEAISTYCRPLDPLEWLNTSWRREIKYSRKPRLEALKWLFPQNKEEEQLDFYPMETHVSGNGKFSVRESRAIYQEFEGVELSEDDDSQSSDDLGFDNTLRGAEIELKAIISDSPNELSEFFEIWENERLTNRRIRSDAMLSVDTVTPFSHRIEQSQVGLLSEAIFQRFKPEVIKLLQVMDSGIIDLVILSHGGNRSSLYIDHKQVGISPLSSFGDGVRRLLFIALTLTKVRGGVLLIDEIETAIHTEALRSSFAWIVQWCKQMNVQLFATTHSLETVDAMLDASNLETDLVLYRLEKRESQTKAVRIERERLQRLREDLGQEVRV
ncbi:DNA replication and repair protein RecF [Microcoleus sp. IPMA8]|uniref:DNA replication and repair protein RecF n=2 Tax=Microcoleus TaxID=44471 RepID=A0ABX2CQN8_9CYAN|nr:DNA replication and repair protein RecF [Microcoleus asticus IPMA8]